MATSHLLESLTQPCRVCTGRNERLLYNSAGTPAPAHSDRQSALHHGKVEGSSIKMLVSWLPSQSSGFCLCNWGSQQSCFLFVNCYSRYQQEVETGAEESSSWGYDLQWQWAPCSALFWCSPESVEAQLCEPPSFSRDSHSGALTPSIDWLHRPISQASWLQYPQFWPSALPASGARCTFTAPALLFALQ